MSKLHVWGGQCVQSLLKGKTNSVAWVFLNPLLCHKLNHIWHLLQLPVVLMPQALLVWIWGYSVILLYKSSSVRECQWKFIWVQIKDSAESPKDIHRIAPQPLLAARVVPFLKSTPQMIFWDFLVALWIEVQNINLTRETCLSLSESPTEETLVFTLKCFVCNMKTSIYWSLIKL